MFNGIEVLVVILFVLLAIVGAVTFPIAMEDIQNRRRAWRLYDAGVIDEAELLERVNR